jgi:MFS family permease
MYVHFFWTLGAILVTLLAWTLLPSYGWRALLYVTSLPVLLAGLLAWCLLPESPRWLLRQGRVLDARQIVAEAALLNSTPLPEQIVVAPLPLTRLAIPPLGQGQGPGSQEQVTAKDLFESGRAGVTVPLMVCWFCFGFCYFGCVLFVIKVFEQHSASDDPFEGGAGECDFDYRAIFISALSELMGLSIATLVIDRWGRVPTQMTAFLCAAVGAFLLSLDEVSEVRLVVISMFARMSIIGANSAVATATPELFETKHRATGHAIVNCAARVGSFFSPYVVESKGVSKLTIGLTIAFVNIVGMCSAFCLPETKGVALDSVRSYHQFDLYLVYS